MKRSIYLDFTLPLFLEKDLIFKYSIFLKSFIKQLEKTNNLKFYISINVFNEIHLNSTFTELIHLIKSLQDSERAEIVISSSFNLSSSSNEQMFVYDMLYSEYFTGYYLGFPRDFEGDSCIMVQNLHSAFFPKVKVSKSYISSLKMLGIERIFVDKRELLYPIKVENLKCVPIDTSMESLFEGFVTLDSIKDFLSHNSSSNVFYLHVFDMFVKHRLNVETNFSTLIYLLDKGSEDWSFIDIDDENVVYSNEVPLNFFNEVMDDLAELDFYLRIKKVIIQYISHQIPEGFQLEGYRRFPLWKTSGESLIDSQNMFNFKLMSLLTSEIRRGNNLPNNHIKLHVSDIIDELLVSEYASESLKSIISDFKEKINQN